MTTISPDFKQQLFIVHRNVSMYNVLLEKLSLSDHIPSTGCFFLSLIPDFPGMLLVSEY